MNKKPKAYVIDTSAILSGKQINLQGAIFTVPGVSSELKPGGRDHRAFEFLKEKGLTVKTPSDEATDKVNVTSTQTGDFNRLSATDKQILALALDLTKKYSVIILTDDYSIQNVANKLGIDCESISQKGIIKNFKWGSKCSGCGKKFKENIKVCPICGAKTKNIISKKQEIK